MSDANDPDDNAADNESAPTCYPLKPPAFDGKKSQSRLAQVDRDSTLEYRCRAVVVAHLERYPAHVMGALSEHAWDSIIEMRHERTAPNKGKRRTPAMTQLFLAGVEEENPHLAESTVADKLVWKDCVEFKFPKNGLARPRGLLFPWPILVQRITKAGTDLLDLYRAADDEKDNNDEASEKEKYLLERAVQTLTDTPINVSLLQQSGIGKTVKKFIKVSSSKKKKKARKLGGFTERRITSCTKMNDKVQSPLDQLEELLQTWKAVAAKSGVAIQAQDRKRASTNDADDDAATIAKDLDRAERVCRTWRELFHCLQRRETKRREKQGAKMRENRERRARDQPRVVKVRPAKAKHEAILNRPMGSKFGVGSVASLPKNRMMLLREESKVAATWQKGGANASGGGSSFGNAVAFAAVGKSAKRLTPGKTKTMTLAGGKRMRVPTKMSASTLKKKLSKPVRKR
mmetsp:Transcript_11425/g.18977  ORF Transcript_11425/g.18977 Transcript_11425/m.18977 type:complete len:459 (+) Transcript_11425:94-1470(+)|eukprot:CAMPEP_0119007306 /NCGR_PEP_ID=MMETSP1176-20130426/2924_1 /TAXON_ID=265551 /ORGANISM="Synedropsis recta cf, Strain CCMP1620" /LENGTH=458 /DNA_ID=CAMNT_0006959425 /DNA_START=86 /DNA_END=1465 /DNA_ORIENTATION=-